MSKPNFIVDIKQRSNDLITKIGIFEINSFGRNGVHKKIRISAYIRIFVDLLPKIPYHRPHNPLNQRVVTVNRLHRGVRRLETDAITLTIEALERRVRVIEKRDDDVAVLRRRVPFHDNVVSVE